MHVPSFLSAGMLPNLGILYCKTLFQSLYFTRYDCVAQVLLFSLIFLGLEDVTYPMCGYQSTIYCTNLRSMICLMFL